MQNSTQNLKQNRNYVAFISYRHKPLDMEAAQRIQKKIEGFRIPKDLRGEDGEDRLGVVFRDEDELPASSSLSSSITDALDHSKYLLVICTPDLPKSRWCEEEIRYFLKTHDRDHVLAVLVDGEPEESFSPYLRYIYDEEGNIVDEVEPLAANISGPGHKINNKAFRKEIVRIYAALLGCPFDALWQRERRARQGRLMGLMGLATAVMAVFIGVVLNRNARISEQNVILQRQLSASYVDQGFSQLESWDVKGALGSALDALPDGADRSLYDRRAELLMCRALHAYQDSSPQPSLLFRQTTDIANFAVDSDETRIFLADQAGTVRGVDFRTGDLLWETVPRPAVDTTYYNLPPWRTEVFAPEGTDVVLCKNAAGVTALSASDGSPVWSWESKTGDGCTFRALASDGRSLLLLDKDAPYDDAAANADLVILDTADGHVIARTTLEATPSDDFKGSGDTAFVPAIRLDPGLKPWYDWGTAFSDDGKTCVLSAYVEYMYEDEDGTLYFREDEDENDSDEKYFSRFYLTFFVLDTSDWSVKECYSFQEDSSYNILCGIKIEENGDILCTRYVSHSGLLCTRIHRPDGRITGGQANVSLSSWTGILIDGDSERYIVPPLFNDSLVLVPLENSLHIFNAVTCEYLTAYNLTSDIVHAEWTDETQQTVELVTEDGSFVRHTFEEGRNWSGYSAVQYDGIHLLTAQTFHKSPVTNPDGCLLAISSANKGDLLMIKNVADPGAVVPDLPPDNTCLGMCLTPSGERLMAFYEGKAPEEPGDGSVVPADDAADGEEEEDDYEYLDSFSDDMVTVVLYDSKTLEKLKEVSYSLYLWTLPAAIDEDHFLCAGTIYGFDGNETYLEDVSEEDAWLMELSTRSARMNNGQLLTVYNPIDEEAESDNPPSWPVWIGDQIVPASQQAETALAFREADAYAAAPNGWVIAHGVPSHDGEGFFPEETVFAAFDAQHGTKTVIPDQNPGHDFLLAPGSREPLFACAYDDGSVYLYNTNNGTGTAQDLGYSPGEIKALAFTDTDEYLLIYTQNARLDIWSAAAWTCVYRENQLTRFGDDSRYVQDFSCTTDPGTHRLHIHAQIDEDRHTGFWFSVDTDTWAVTAECPSRTFGMFGSWVAALSGDTVTAYPVRTLEELVEWAEAGQ